MFAKSRWHSLWVVFLAISALAQCEEKEPKTVTFTKQAQEWYKKREYEKAIANYTLALN